MSRFYISDGAVPGWRVPVATQRQAAKGRQSDVLNEAQAIARGRKLTATLAAPTKPTYRYLRMIGSSNSFAHASSYDSWNMQEVEVWSGGAKLALAAANVISVVSDLSPGFQHADALFDGAYGQGVSYSNGLNWSATTAAKQFTIDLGAVRTLDAIKLWDCSANAMYQFAWWGSNDNATWTKFFDSGPRVVGVSNVNATF